MRHLASAGRRAILVTVLSFTACGGSDGSGTGIGASGDAGARDGALGPSSPGVALAHEYNLLVKDGYDLRCKVCPCNGFSPSSPQGEACTGAIFDQYPGAKRQAVCKIGVLRQYRRCLQGAPDCGSADMCEGEKHADDAQCPSFSVDAAVAA